MSIHHQIVNREFHLPARLALLLAACLAIGCDDGSRQAGRTVQTPPPAGVVLIVIDTLRADHVGAWGSTSGHTPSLDGVAARGVLFENAVAPSSWTRSSIASLFTSRYPTSIGALGREDAIAREVVTLAEILRAEGFETLAVNTNRNAGRVFGFAQGFDRFEVPDLKAGYPGDYEIHVAEGVTRKALRVLDDRSGRRPFFLYLLYVDPHDPYLPHPELNGPEPPGRFDGSRRQLTQLDSTPPEEVTEADRARIRHLYAGEVEYCDLWIGELLRGLEERGLRDDVLLIVTADHGEGLWDHGFRAHGRDLYQEMLHVPLIVDFPAADNGDAPRRVTAPVSLLDVAPTILAAFGIAAPADYHGLDLAPLTRGERRSRRHDYVYAELDLDGRSLEALRHEEQKLIHKRWPPDEPRELELYDLAADPNERHDLAAGRPDVLARLARTLEGVSAEVTADPMRSERVSLATLDEETANNLRALGYLAGNEGPGGPEDAGDALAAVIDFSRSDHDRRQILGGFHGLESGFRWMSGRSRVLLGRSGGETSWRLTGWVDLDLHDRDTVAVTARVEGDEPQRRTLDRSGAFVLEGPVPAGAGPSVRLDFACDHEAVPALRGGGDDRRSLCVAVQSVGLY
jgi:arylsulfatase A-like enzyme